MATMEAKPEPAGIRPTFTLGDRLRKAREVAGLTIDDMADELGTSTKTVYSYEGDKGVRGAPRSVILAWAPRIRRSLPVTLTPEQVHQVLAACPGPREMLMVLLMVQLGMRAGEVAGAQTGDVDLANRLMRIQGKGGHERVEPIPTELFMALVVWLRTAPAGPLIGRQVGSSWLPLSRKHISGLTCRIMYDSGVKLAAGDMVSAHALRRTAISDVLEGGASLNVVQAFAGHNQIASLSPYIRLRPAEDLRAAVEGRSYLELG